MNYFEIDTGDYIITFDNLKDALKYVDRYFERHNVVLGITRKGE